MAQTDVTAVVLAAGRGRRVWPYGEVRQKCAIPVAGTPLVARTVADIRAAGVNDIRVVVGHRAGDVRAAFVTASDAPLFMDQPAAEGSAHAALCGLRGDTPNAALIVYGDVLVTARDIAAVLAPVRDGEATAAALVVPLDREDPRDWIGATVDNDCLTAVEGHPRGGRQRLGGVFACAADPLRFVRANPGIMRSVPVGGMPPVEADLAESVQMMIDAGVQVRAVAASGPVVDVDKPWHIIAANQTAVDLRCERSDADRVPASCRISDGADIGGRLLLGDNVTIGKRVVVNGDLIAADGAQITNGAMLGHRVFVGRNARVRDYCQLDSHAVVGDHGIVAHGAEFAGVMFDRVYLYHYCEICGVLGSAVDIGAATVCGTLRFDDDDTVHRIAGRRERPSGWANASYLGDYSRTGVNAMLMPGVKVGPYSCVGPGVVLYNDVRERQVVLVRQELEFKDWGPERYGW